MASFGPWILDFLGVEHGSKLSCHFRADIIYSPTHRGADQSPGANLLLWMLNGRRPLLERRSGLLFAIKKLFRSSLAQLHINYKMEC